MRGKPVTEVNAEAGQRTEGSDLTQGCERKRLPAKGNTEGEKKRCVRNLERMWP